MLTAPFMHAYACDAVSVNAWVWWQVAYKTLSPEWNEPFEFFLMRKQLFDKSFSLQVKDYDGRLNAADALGSAQLDLATNLSGVEKESTLPLDTQGELIVSFSWVPVTEAEARGGGVLFSPRKMTLSPSSPSKRNYPARFTSSGLSIPVELRLRRARRLKGFKNRMFAKLQKKLTSKLEAMYVDKLKLNITPDRRMPWALRVAVHDLVDEVWSGVKATRLPPSPYHISYSPARPLPSFLRPANTTSPLHLLAGGGGEGIREDDRPGSGRTCEECHAATLPSSSRTP